MAKEGASLPSFCFEIEQSLIPECKKSSNLTHEFERTRQSNLILIAFLQKYIGFW